MKSQKFVSHLVRRIAWDEIDAQYLRNLVSVARQEDLCGLGLAKRPAHLTDITTMSIDPRSRAEARLVARRDMVVCGLRLVPLIIEMYSSLSAEASECVFIPEVSDSDKVCAGTVLGRIEGGGRVMLQAERIMLNFLQRLSGVATETAKYVAALKGSKTMLLDTRKTTPGLRVLEKYAFACGGGHNHRMGLFDRVMLKDNHLVCADSAEGSRLCDVVRGVREKNPDVAVEVEVDRLSQIGPVLEAGADVILLDNFSIADLKLAVGEIADAAWTEASGGVNLETLGPIGEVGPDFASSGAPIHSSAWIDIGLDS